MIKDTEIKELLEGNDKAAPVVAYMTLGELREIVKRVGVERVDVMELAAEESARVQLTAKGVRVL